MDKELRDKILNSFPNSRLVGIQREYHTGRSGSPVFAVKYNPVNSYGLDGTFIVKFGSADWANAEGALYSSLAKSALASLLARYHMPSQPVEEQAAVAYDVAFHSIMEPQPLMSILDEGSQSEDVAQKQVEELAQALVNWYLDSNLADKSIVEDQHALLMRMLTERRTNNLLERLQSTLPFWRADALQITIEGLNQRLPNPLVYIQKESWQQITHNPTCPLGRIHGDLHTGNVICSSQHIPKIIDFCQSQEDGVPFFDLAYLEFDIMQHLLAVEQEKNRKQWLSLLNYSMATIEGEQQTLTHPWDAARAWRFIKPIRQGVQRLRAFGGEDYEIVWWLSTVAVGLNFARKGQPTRSRFERMAGMLYAAYGLARILELFHVKELMTELSPVVPWLQEEEHTPLASDFLLSLAPQESTDASSSTDVQQPAPLASSPSTEQGALQCAQLDLPPEPDAAGLTAPPIESFESAAILASGENTLTTSVDATADRRNEAAKKIQKMLQDSLDRFNTGGAIYRDECDDADLALQQLGDFIQDLRQKITRNQYDMRFPLENILDLQKNARAALHSFRENCSPLTANRKQLSPARYNEVRTDMSNRLDKILAKFLALLKQAGQLL